MTNLTTCETVFQQSKQSRLVGTFGAGARDLLWCGIQCGLQQPEALSWVIRTQKVILTDVDRYTDEVNSLFEIYRRGCEIEFQQMPPEVQTEIGSTEKYRNLRYLMFDATNVPLQDLQSIHNYRFLGKNCTVHDDFHKRLLAAEIGIRAKFEDWGLSPADYEVLVKPIGVLGFQWRARKSARVQYTNHMFGMAVDIAAASSPHFSGEMAKTADAILAFLSVDEIENPPPPLRRPSRFAESVIAEGHEQLLREIKPDLVLLEYDHLRLMVNALFGFIMDTQSDLPQLLATATHPNADENARNEAGKKLQLLGEFTLAAGDPSIKGTKRRAADGYKKINDPKTGWLFHHGRIMDIPSLLIVALVEQGLTTGGEYRTSKDPMQFEMPKQSIRDGEEIRRQFRAGTANLSC